MGEIKTTNEKKKSQLRFNVGGGVVLGGVVLLGGGLAVAGLMAAFSIIKNRNFGKHYHKNQDSTTVTPSDKIHDGSPGLSFVLQNPSTAVHQNSCCTSHGTPTIDVTVTESLMDPKELVSAHNMALEEKTLPTMVGEKEDPSNCHQEIISISSDDLNKECIESSNEESPAPENIIKNDPSKNWQLTENIEAKKEDEPAELRKLAAVEEILTMQSLKGDEEQEQGVDDDNNNDDSEEHMIEKEEEIAEGELAPKEEGDDHDDNSNEDNSSEDVTEKEEHEESSEGTGSSSVESNVEAIWPTEMIEALSQELEGINANKAKPESYAYLNRKIDDSVFNGYGNNNGTTENSGILNEKGENIHLPRREVFVWWFLAVLFLLLLLHIHRTVTVHDLSCQNSVLGPRV